MTIVVKRRWETWWAIKTARRPWKPRGKKRKWGMGRRKEREERGATYSSGMSAGFMSRHKPGRCFRRFEGAVAAATFDYKRRPTLTHLSLPRPARLPNSPAANELCVFMRSAIRLPDSRWRVRGPSLIGIYVMPRERCAPDSNLLPDAAFYVASKCSRALREPSASSARIKRGS